MADKPSATKPKSPLRRIKDAPNDGFPAEKDVSTPPPGTDQSKGRKDKKEK
ncbi:hypothetical protein [Haloferula sp. BvORR071]|uniref:hypothetical protein n=1 Tax=Haloferula sp. BvORR071 TaxID=1396141 RepID=UPI002240F7BE|nr:hypothetical protein [Haloferula sp. BvORR071]